MKKYLKLIIIALVLATSTTSCSVEQRTISKMERLVNNIEKKGARYSKDDWKDVVEDYQDIKDEAKSCNFTAKEQEKMGQLEGRAIAGFVRWAGEKVSGIVGQGKGILQGILEGLGL